MKLSVVVLIAFFSLVCVTNAHAFIWYEVGDAGNLLSTAQLIYGDGAINQIKGALGSGSTTHVDIFAFEIPIGSAFSASTIGGASFDTQLFLFDSTGKGVYANDNAGNATTQSTLPANHTFSPTTSGLYYLAISRYDRDPYSGPTSNTTSAIFLDTPRYAVHGPDGPGGNGVLTHWEGSLLTAGNYTINLNGASGVPEPTSIALLGLGLFGLVGLGRKRK